MTVQEQKISVEAFWQMAQDPIYTHKRLELIDGEIVVMSPSSNRNPKIAATIARLIGNYVAENDLGDVTGADGGYIISNDAVLSPDAAFIAKEHIPIEDFVFYPVPPDLAVEVISPSESRPKVREKTRKYLEAGTQIVWNVYPDEQTVDRVTLAEGGQLLIKEYKSGETIDATPAVPGFTVPVAEFFN